QGEEEMEDLERRWRKRARGKVLYDGAAMPRRLGRRAVSSLYVDDGDTVIVKSVWPP
ncbi:hypothetical protein MTO96_033731, partial [Rhipicephalus appendiculatus]